MQTAPTPAPTSDSTLTQLSNQLEGLSLTVQAGAGSLGRGIGGFLHNMAVRLGFAANVDEYLMKAIREKDYPVIIETLKEDYPAGKCTASQLEALKFAFAEAVKLGQAYTVAHIIRAGYSPSVEDQELALAQQPLNKRVLFAIFSSYGKIYPFLKRKILTQLGTQAYLELFTGLAKTLYPKPEEDQFNLGRAAEQLACRNFGLFTSVVSSDAPEYNPELLRGILTAVGGFDVTQLCMWKIEGFWEHGEIVEIIMDTMQTNLDNDLCINLVLKSIINYYEKPPAKAEGLLTMLKKVGLPENNVWIADLLTKVARSPFLQLDNEKSPGLYMLSYILGNDISFYDIRLQESVLNAAAKLDPSQHYSFEYGQLKQSAVEMKPVEVGKPVAPGSQIVQSGIPVDCTDAAVEASVERTARP